MDLRALALFRIGLGLIVSGDALDRCRSLMLLTDEGPSPRALLESLGGWPSLHGFSGGTGVTQALLAAQALVGLALAAGVVTRVAAVCSFLLVASVQHRAPLGPFAGDNLLRALLFWSLFLPLGARLSIDARGDRRPGLHLSAATVALVLQPIVMYLSSACWKLTDPSWRAGDALAFVLRMRLHTGELADTVALLPVPVLRTLSWASLVIEGLVPLLLLLPRPKIRVVGIVVLMLFQASMDALLTVGFFAWLSNIALLPALPAAVFKHATPAPATTTERRWSNFVVGLLVVTWLTWVLGAFAVPRPPLSKPLSLLGLAQKWEMFGHPGGIPRGWFCAPAQRADGSVVDVMTGLPPVETPPELGFSNRFTFRERNTLLALLYEPYAPFAPGVGTWLCRRYNHGRPPAERIVQIEGFFVDEAFAPPKLFTLFSGPCS